MLHLWWTIRRPGAQEAATRAEPGAVATGSQGVGLRFLTASEVPFTNNPAEQDLRMMTLRTKISAASSGHGGAGDFATARSVLSSACKQGRDRIEALLQAPGAMLAALCS